MTQQTKKKPKTKRVIALLTAVVMGFMIAAFSACDNFECILQQQVNAVSAEVYAVQKDDYATIANIDALLAELAELRAEVKYVEGEGSALLTRIDKYEAQLKALRGQLEQLELAEYKDKAIRVLEDYIYNFGADIIGDYEGLRIAMRGFVEGGVALINTAEDKESVRTALAAAKNQVRGVPLRPITAEDFLLTITVRETTIPLGRSVRADVEFKNVSGQDLVVGYIMPWQMIVYTFWDGYQYVFVHVNTEGYPLFTNMEKNAVHRLDNVVIDVPERTGTHHVKLDISRYSGWNFELMLCLYECCISQYWFENWYNHNISISSNIVTVTVV